MSSEAHQAETQVGPTTTATSYAKLFLAMVTLTTVQNFVAALVNAGDALLANGVVALKDLALLTTLLVAIARVIGRRATWKQGDRFEILVVGTAALIVGLSAVSPYANLLSARQLLIFPLYLLFGTFFARHCSLRDLERGIVTILVVVCVSGYLERFVLYNSGEDFWNAVNLDAFEALKGSDIWSVDGVPQNFYTSEITGYPIRRMVSLLIAEPTLLGHFVAFGVLYSLIARRRRLFLVTAPALILTFSKGGLLAVVIGYVLYYNGQRRVSRALKALLLFGLLAAIAGLAYLSITTDMFGSVPVHLAGLVTNLFSLTTRPFGYGVGSVGNFAVLAAEAGGASADLDGYALGESFVGSMVGQIGVIGLALYLAFFVLLWRRKVDPDDPFALSIKYTLLSTMAAGLASESAVSYVGTGFLIGLAAFLFAPARAKPAAETAR